MVKNSELKKPIYYILTVMVLSLVLTIVLVVFVTLPGANEMRRIGSELNVGRASVDNLSYNLSVLKDSRAREAELEQKNNLISSALPNTDEASRLFYQIEAVAKASNVSVSSVTEGSSEEALTVAEGKGLVIPINYSVKGSSRSYRDLRVFLEKTSNSLRIISINSIDIRVQEGGLSFDININTYKRG